LFLLAALVGGCASQRPEAGAPWIAEYHPGGAVATAAAPYRADYALYQTDESAREQRLLWRGLAEQERVGFDRTGEGELVAVAGPDRVPLTDGCYAWRITPETELRGAALLQHDTRKALAATCRFVGGAAVGVVLFPVVVLWKVPVSPFPW
jgi:hypothetical protein